MGYYKPQPGPRPDSVDDDYYRKSVTIVVTSFTVAYGAAEVRERIRPNLKDWPEVAIAILASLTSGGVSL